MTYKYKIWQSTLYDNIWRGELYKEIDSKSLFLQYVYDGTNYEEVEREIIEDIERLKIKNEQIKLRQKE